MLRQRVANFVVQNGLVAMQVNLKLVLARDVTKPGELIKMSSKGIAGMIECLVASADEAAALYNVVAVVEGRS